SLVIRAIRDYFQPDIGEILIDTDDIYDQAHQFMSHVMPDMVHRVKRYSDDVPLFSRFQIEHQIETAYSRTVPLPSGGAIVIDHTEALVSVDVNSARATRGSDIETTAFNTNCEAAEEVARQLRLRDLGGLIVIDFIDMEVAKNQREVETRLKDALHFDRARVQMGKISRFGLMELSRQRLRPSLSEGSHVTCPRCSGTGHIRDTESSALQVLRIIQEEAMKENSATIHVQVPVDVAAFLLNEKRGEVLKIESRHRVTIILIPNKHLETPHYKLERIKHDDPRLEQVEASYTMAEHAETDIGYNERKKEEVKARQEAVVKGITPDQPAPIVERKLAPTPVVAPVAMASEEGFFSRIFGFFRQKPATPAPVIEVAKEVKPSHANDRDRNGRGQRGRGRNGRNNRGERDEREAGRTTPQEESAKLVAQVPAISVGDNSDNKSGRPPRQPRPPREPREGNEANRNPRPPRQREEAKEVTASAPKADETLRKDELAVVAAANAVVSVAPTSVSLVEAKDPLLANTGPEGEAVEGEEPRRRRRRGGRNRNRRDREGGEASELTELSNQADADADQNDEAPALTMVASAPAQVELVKQMVDVSEAAAPAVAATVITATVTSPALAVVETAAAEVIAAPAPVAASVIAPVLNLVQTEVKAEVVNTVAAEIPAPVVIAAAEVQAEVQATATPIAEAIESIPAVIPPAPVASVIAAPVQQVLALSEPAAVAVPLADLQQVLGSAGLTLAATDPVKLRAAQEAAANQAPPVRVPRVRKPVQQQADEPLVQIGTRQD
ncbi:MAG: ribonuclease E/G, partial [Pseudomonadota bacterium]